MYKCPHISNTILTNNNATMANQAFLQISGCQDDGETILANLEATPNPIINTRRNIG
jgi:hypothetical protein